MCFIQYWIIGETSDLRCIFACPGTAKSIFSRVPGSHIRYSCVSHTLSGSRSCNVELSLAYSNMPWLQCKQHIRHNNKYLGLMPYLTSMIDFNAGVSVVNVNMPCKSINIYQVVIPVFQFYRLLLPYLYCSEQALVVYNWSHSRSTACLLDHHDKLRDHLITNFFSKHV